MDTTSGDVVNGRTLSNVARQFTFKTTIDTTWLDPILEGMENKERSDFIRTAIIEKLDRSHKVTQKVTQGNTSGATDKPQTLPEPTLLLPTIVAKESAVVDLNSKLDSMDF